MVRKDVFNYYGQNFPKHFNQLTFDDREKLLDIVVRREYGDQKFRVALFNPFSSKSEGSRIPMNFP